MSLWDRIRRTAADDWFVASPAPGDGEPVRPEEQYLSAFLTAMRVRDVRVGTRTFYGSVTSRFEVGTRRGDRAEFLTVSTPKVLRDADPRNLDHVVTGRQRLLGPVPYRGGDVIAEIGLFSVPSSDLLAPYLQVVEDITRITGVGLVTAAAPLVPTAKKALDLLFGASDRPQLEIGLAVTLAEPVTGHHCVVRAPRDRYRGRTLSLAGDDRLVDETGAAIEEPYLVFELSASARRDDWAEIPQLQRRYADVQDAVVDDDLNRAKEALAQFRRAAIFCDDLLRPDGVRLHGLVEQSVLDAFPETGTSAGERPPLPELPAYDLYGD